MHNRIQDNRGLSLVELIVVIAIVSVMLGIMSLSISMMFSRDANYVAVRIDDALTEARMLSMSQKGSFAYELHVNNTDKKGSKILIKRTVAAEVPGDPPALEDEKEIKLDKSVDITVTGDGIDADETDFVIVFNKANGSVETVNGSPAKGIYTISVTATRNTSKTSVVTLVAATGRHFTEK